MLTDPERSGQSREALIRLGRRVLESQCCRSRSYTVFTSPLTIATHSHWLQRATKRLCLIVCALCILPPFVNLIVAVAVFVEIGFGRHVVSVRVSSVFASRCTVR